MASVAQLVGVPSQTERLQVQFPVRTHTYVVGSIPGLGTNDPQSGCMRGQPIDVSLSHQHFSLPLLSL